MLGGWKQNSPGQARSRLSFVKLLAQSPRFRPTKSEHLISTAPPYLTTCI